MRRRDFLKSVLAVGASAACAAAFPPAIGEGSGLRVAGRHVITSTVARVKSVNRGTFHGVELWVSEHIPAGEVAWSLGTQVARSLRRD